MWWYTLPNPLDVVVYITQSGNSKDRRPSALCGFPQHRGKLTVPAQTSLASFPSFLVHSRSQPLLFISPSFDRFRDINDQRILYAYHDNSTLCDCHLLTRLETTQCDTTCKRLSTNHHTTYPLFLSLKHIPIRPQHVSRVSNHC